MYHWTDDMIRFMHDASEYGDYHKQLSDLIYPYLSGVKHLCDAGCGLGDLSIALAGRIPEITAIDLKPQAIRELRNSCRAGGISNIRALEGDIHQMPPAVPYDGMIFCFFGRSEEIFEIVRRQCRGTVVVIKKNYANHRFSVGSYPNGPDGYTRTQQLLDDLHVPYQKQAAALEFGQPFRSFADVRAFYQCYSRDEDPDVLTDEFLRSQVTETGDAEFPLYLPHRRHLGIISFQAGDLP